jgi:hypothetical protein
MKYRNRPDAGPDLTIQLFNIKSYVKLICEEEEEGLCIENCKYVALLFSKLYFSYTWSVFFSLLSLFWKNKSRLMRSLSCMFVSVFSHQILNAWTSLYVTWYICQGTWAHLSRIHHKFFPSVWLSGTQRSWSKSEKSFPMHITEY